MVYLFIIHIRLKIKLNDTVVLKSPSIYNENDEHCKILK